MSATTQSNGKKSSNNSPSSTPVINGNSQPGPQTTPPPPNNAPKYGTRVPNRIFVGGIAASTAEADLIQLFSSYGPIKAAKIIQDRAGVSRGYGFVTFETEEDAKRSLKDCENIVLKERKLNVAPAIKKQPFNRAFDGSSPPTVTAGNAPPYFFSHNTGMPFFQGGVTYYPQPPPSAPGDPNSQPATMYQAPPVYPAQSGPPQAPTYPSMMFPQTMYMPQQYPMPVPYEFNYYPNNGGPQYMVGGQNGPTQSGAAAPSTSQGPPMPPPNSPPRAPCYNPPQLHYNPDLFYNLPLYNTPIESTQVYPESLDMANGGGFNEQMRNNNGQSNFGMPSRRNKRSTRRSSQPTSGSLSEVGGGDATPITTPSVGDVVRGVETMKL